MSWGTALSVAGSLSGAFGGSKEAERNAQDAAANARNDLKEAQAAADANSRPFIDTGVAANALLADYLGIGLPDGFRAKPTLQQAQDEIRKKHFQRFGSDYDRNSNFGGQATRAQALYEQNLAEWEKDLASHQEQNPDSMGDGRLLKQFTNEDFVKDPGYNFRLSEGEKGVDRALAARGGRESGAALKAIAKYNQDFSSNEFQAAYNRDALDKNRTYSFLSGQSAQGLGAAQGNNALAANVASNSASINGNLTNTLLALNNQREQNQQNGIQSAIGNFIYGTERAKNSSVFGTPPYVPSSGGSSSLPSPWYK